MNSAKELIKTIDMLLSEIEKSYQRNKKYIKFETLYSLMSDLAALMENLDLVDKKNCSKIAITRYIPLLNLIIRLDRNTDRLATYHDFLKTAYTYGARISFEHFLIRYEWDSNDKVYEKRNEILKSYVYYLNYMCYHPEFETIVCNLPSGYGKTRIEKLYEAFRLGLDPTGTFLSICSNDGLVKAASRSVIDIIKSEEYALIFPHLDYSKDKKMFTKETDGEWKLKQCHLNNTYIAQSRESNVVGVRASLSIHIDDMYGDPAEALNMSLNRRLWDKYITVWVERFVKNKIVQKVITGTLWSPYDLLSQIIDSLKKEHTFTPHPKFKFTQISEDGKHVIIQVPALDPITGESTCPELVSTKELLKKKAKMSNYLWQCNFQQNPIPPEGLEFDWNNLKQYDFVPMNETGFTEATLDPARRGHDYVSMPIFQKYGDDYALVDVLFERNAMSELYDKIADKIIENNVVKLVIENNTDTSLKTVIEDRLAERCYYACIIIEKYNTIKKELRIQAQQGVIKRQIWFPNKEMYGITTPMGMFMEQLTMFSFTMPNKFDDAIDSVAMFCSEIIQGNAKPQRAFAIKRPF